MNRVTLIGNLGKKPEVRKTGNGKSVCTFSMATTKSFKKHGSSEWEKTTTWWNIVIWGDKADKMAALLDKGSQVFVEGEGRQNKYTDKTGIERVSLDIHAEEIKLLAKVDRQDSAQEDSPTGGGLNSMVDED